MKKKKIKILIVEQSDIIRQGVATLLTENNNMSLIAEQCDGECNIQHSIRKVSPKILIASPTVFAQNEKQITALKDEFQLLSVALVYSFQHPDNLSNYNGLIYINDKAEKVQTTIHDLLKSHDTTNNTTQSKVLTNREKEILKLLANGNTTKEIANTLHISPHTVNAHRKNIMRKLDIKTVSGLTVYAVLNNIITLKEV